jgi:hypothetical protein
VIYQYVGPYPADVTVFPGGESFHVEPGDLREFADPPGPNWVLAPVKAEVEPEVPARTRKGQAQVDA